MNSMTEMAGRRARSQVGIGNDAYLPAIAAIEAKA